MTRRRETFGLSYISQLLCTSFQTAGQVEGSGRAGEAAPPKLKSKSGKLSACFRPSTLGPLRTLCCLLAPCRAAAALPLAPTVLLPCPACLHPCFVLLCLPFILFHFMLTALLRTYRIFARGSHQAFSTHVYVSLPFVSV